MTRIDPALLDPKRYPFGFETTTRYSDLDPNGHVNNVAMAEILEDARVRFALSVDLANALEAANPMVAANHLEYIAQAYYPAPVSVHVGVLLLGRSSWTLQAIAAQERRVVASGRTVLVCTRDGRSMPIPDLLRPVLAGGAIRP